MKLKETDLRLVCCALAVALSLGGCSKNGVSKHPNITDKSLSESTTGNGKPRKESRGSQYDTLWDRLFALYALPPVENGDIDRELAWFSNHPAYIERAQSRAEPFLYSIVKLIEKQEVPGEIALLPIVESAFQPHVVSPARAAGIWQFIPSTGTNYGLKRSRSYDGRRDVYASTKAAIKYLKKLHGDFGDWLLAIAAYNCGEGAVSRAIRRNAADGLPTDFWSLNLPQETRAYVPKLLAISRIFADSDKYGINLREMPNNARFKPVKVTSQLDLALAAEAAGMSLDQLRQLNPGFRGQYADVDGSYHLYIPADRKAADFRQELERLTLERKSYASPDLAQDDTQAEPGSFQSFRREMADQGVPADTASVAEQERDGVPARRSPRRTETGRTQDDEPSRKPVRVADAPDDTERAGHERHAASRDKAAAASRNASYSVQKGETLHSVARKYSVNVSELAKWNHIPITTEVQAGQKLQVSDAGLAERTDHAGHTAARPAHAASGHSGHGRDEHASHGKAVAVAAEEKTASHPAKGGKTAHATEPHKPAASTPEKPAHGKNHGKGQGSH